MNSDTDRPERAGAPWNPMLPWIDLSLRALDLSMGMTQSWQQWMAGVGTLMAAGARRDETPKSIPVRALRERAAARDEPNARPKRPSRQRAKGKPRALA
jgi:hypothetical protein